MHKLVVLFLCLYFGISQLLFAGISRNQYQTILHVLDRTYQSDFKKQKKRLQINARWEDGERQASAWIQEDRGGIIAVLRIPGGIARTEQINADAFALIVCHEIGHHLAGPPMIWKYSIEGQADYFGVSECLRRVLPRLPENSAFRISKTPWPVVKLCTRAYDSHAERNICMRSAIAGARLAGYFAHKRHIQEPSFYTPARETAQTTDSGIPTPQCRLDTYLAAALCNPEQNSNQNESPAWLCQQERLGLFNQRPECWFKGPLSGDEHAARKRFFPSKKKL